MAGIYYKESQKVDLSWKWIFFIALYILMFWALFEQFTQTIDIPAVTSIVFSICLIVFFNFIIIIMRLDIEIDESRIIYRFKPFHVKPRIIYWNEISNFYVRKYKPIREYGGYGLQRKLRFGKSFTVSGKMGLQLVLNNGNKILIGTQKPNELVMIIKKIKGRTN